MAKKISRRKARAVKIGGLSIGGDHPIAVQTMVNTPPDKIDETIKEINRAAGCGAEIVRVAVPDKRAAAALADIKKGTDIPLVADIHFNHHFALMAADAGFDKLRINPGNIGDESKIRAVVEKAGEKGIPIRIGVNQGSVETDLVDKFGGPKPEAKSRRAPLSIPLNATGWWRKDANTPFIWGLRRRARFSGEPSNRLLRSVNCFMTVSAIP
jgi:(E)-4-hydroxy-3-methylbut-2-enyl-diphosphate synthase